MRRREFVAALAAVAAAPLPSRAQQSGRLRRVAFLMATAESDPETQRRIAGFRKGLSALGWIEGETIRVETRFAAGSPERIQAHAKELVDSAPDVLVTNGTPGTAALKRATSRIPIVFAVITDPVGDGFVATLSKPGGNVTGFTAFESEMGGKWVELLKEIAPGIKRLALLFNPRTVPGGGTALMRPFYDAAARTLNLELAPMPVQDVAEIERSLSAHAAQGAAGVIAMPDGFLFVNRALIVRLTTALQLPTVYPFRFFASSGGLLSYGVDTVDLNIRAASYVHRILNGESPADLPVQAPTKFELVINLKTARALGLAVPPTLLARADEVIE